MEEKFTENDKLQAEVQKLRAEATNLSRSYLQQPASWIALGSLAISLVANYAQHSDAQNKNTLAQTSEKLARIEEKEHQLNKEKLAEQELQLGVSVAAKQRALDEQLAQFAGFEQKLKDIQVEIAKAGATKESIAKATEDLQNSTQKFARSNAETALVLSTPINKTHDIGTARELEIKGFDLLIAGDFEGALAAFSGSENANNSYHHAYEISRLLRQNRAQFSDQAVRKNILQTITSRYSLYATGEQVKSLKAIAK